MGRIKKWISKYFSDEEILEILLSRPAYKDKHIHKKPVKMPKGTCLIDNAKW